MRMLEKKQREKIRIKGTGVGEVKINIDCGWSAFTC